MFLHILIALFASLLIYQMFFSQRLVEGLENTTNNNTAATNTKEYQPYNLSDPNNALILSQQNAGNIEVLKGRVDDLDGIKKKVDDMKQSMDMMQTQIDSLVQQQADYAQELAGSTPPTITGTDGETTADVESSMEQMY